MPDQDAARLALAEALLTHDTESYVVLEVVRDPDGGVADLRVELASTSAGQPPPLAAGGLARSLRRLAGEGGWFTIETQLPAQHRGEPPGERTYEVYARRVGSDRVVCQLRDVTQVRAAQRALQEQAWQDPLTGLPNRRLLLDHLAQALSRLQRHRGVVALLFCDLDDFKRVNDTLGHPAGDELLRDVARRFSAAVRPEDTVARFGGDEFVVLCEGMAGDVDPAALANRIRDAVAGDQEVRGTRVQVGVSVGVAATDRPVPAAQLLAEADRALYRAKRGPDVGG